MIGKGSLNAFGIHPLVKGSPLNEILTVFHEIPPISPDLPGEHLFRQNPNRHNDYPIKAVSRHKPSLNFLKLGERFLSGSITGPIFLAHSCFTCPGRGQPHVRITADPPSNIASASNSQVPHILSCT